VEAMPRRDLLVRLQQRLLADLEECPSRESAAISKELRALAAELESVPTGEVSSVDDLARRRAARRAETAG
jgi:hypothetical protein